MALWDAGYLDLVEPASIAFDGQGAGAFAFGFITGALGCHDTPDGVEFTWQGPMKWIKPAAMAGLNSTTMGRSLVGAASITQTT